MIKQTCLVVHAHKGAMEQAFVKSKVVEEDIRGSTGYQAIEVNLLLLWKPINAAAQLFIIQCRPEGVLYKGLS